MDPDTYKPVLSVVLQPVNKSDWFQPGEYYVPRRLRSGAGKIEGLPYVVPLLLIVVECLWKKR